jgi:gas vesicle protein
MFKAKIQWGRIAVAFAVGAVAGAATALLLAPTTGKKLQKQIKNAVEDQYENVEKLVKKVVA